MLARTAEYLFWTGRYLERAESTARQLDVTYHRLLEVTPAEESDAWSDVLVAVGLLPVIIVCRNLGERKSRVYGPAPVAAE